MFIFGVICYLFIAAAVVGLICLIIKAITKLFTVNDLKITLLAIAVFVVLACVALSPIASRAEELPEEFYYKVVFIDEVEEQEEELLIHTDDLDHLWDFWEDYPEEDEEFMEYKFDRDLSNIALRFIVDNQILAELDKEERIVRGRIIVLTMWECDPNDPFDEEVVDVYYTEFVTE